MTNEQRNEAIKALHLPIQVKKLEAQVAALTAERDALRETLRDRFAMATLAGVCANPTFGNTADGFDYEETAGTAYFAADAMMEARKK